MRCPALAELPPPPPGKNGWPWTEDSLRVPGHGRDTFAWPRITVVTPSFNQGQFIEETIRSILLQGYPDLEYLVLDGGSTDNSIEVIRKYSSWISFWVSEADTGQSAAINRGLRMGSGSYATWINSDDMLCKNALTSHSLSIGFTPELVYVGDCIHIDHEGTIRNTHRGRVQSLEDLVRVSSVWRMGGSIDQPAVLFPLELAVRLGGLNEANHYTMDYELWGRFFLAGTEFRYTEIPFGIFRCHDAQKTKDRLKQTLSMLDVAANLVAMTNSLPNDTKSAILEDLQHYRQVYPEKLWKNTGRLAKMCLPRPVVMALRTSKQKLGAQVKSLVRTFHGSR